MRKSRYLNFLLPAFNTGRTKELFVNPTVMPVRADSAQTHIQVFEYDQNHLDVLEPVTVEEIFQFKHTSRVSWINIGGIRKADVELICAHFGIHGLLVEDILSVEQRPKMDEIDNVLFCLLNMLYFNQQKVCVETEQTSIILGQNFVISFQDDAERDLFNPIREKLKSPTSKLRNSGPDYLCYMLLDTIVDHYYEVMELLGERMEALEEEIIRKSNTRSLGKINSLRKELIVLKRNVTPVKDMINGIVKSESELIDERTTKYFKDVQDHILQAADLADNYRDMMMNLQDLYLSNVNLKTNEVMKVIAIVTCLLAPATVIGGIFGMNFDVIPYAHQEWGFFLAVGLMLVVPLIMLWVFRHRGWF
ncbi:MAG: corA [Chitinophagaceae bacterium]|jgi:magnesium transporter|nr:corA [Chitinophagaceae bacterium]